MPYAQDCSELVQAVFDLLDGAKVALELEDVWYGDQQLLPHTPSACVIAGTTATTLAGPSMYMQSDFEVSVLIYHSKLQDIQVTEKECTERGEAVKDLLNQDISLGGLVIQGFVTAIEPGYIDKRQGQTWYRTTRVTWAGFSRYHLA